MARGTHVIMNRADSWRTAASWRRLFPGAIHNRLGLPPGFMAGLSAYGGSEAMTKVSRLAVVIVVARELDPVAIGLAAAAMAASDILKAFTENGVVQRIILARDEDLGSVCATARRIFWQWCIGLFLIQCAIAGAMFLATDEVMVPLLLAILAAEYIFMPGGLVNCSLAMREGRLSSTAMISGGQAVLANLATAALVLIWPSPLAIVVPKVLSAPVWLFGMRRLRPWSLDRTVQPAPVRPFIGFGAAILGGEIVKALRLQADKLVIGALLGAEALGIYFLAFNAGLGIATSFSRAFAIVLFPYLCMAEDRERALGDALKVAVIILAPVVLLQAALAPFYVPLVFGERWNGASEIVSILCVAAIPSLIWSAAGQWLRARDQAGFEFAATTSLTVGLIGSTALLAPYGLVTIAWGYLAVSTIIQFAVSLPALRSAFLKSK